MAPRAAVVSASFASPNAASAVGATSACSTGWGSNTPCLNAGPGHDQRHVELVGGEAAVARVGAGVLLERAGRGVGGVDLVQRPVVLREHDDVRLVGAVRADVVEPPRPQGSVGGQRARDVDAGEGAALDQRHQLVRDVGLRRRARGRARPVDVGVDLGVAVLVQERVAGGGETARRALGGDDGGELAVGGRRAARAVRAERDLLVRVDLAVVEREEDVRAVE